MKWSGIRSLALHGEAASVVEASVTMGRLRLHEFLASYTDDKIYDMDKTGFFLRPGPAPTIGTTAGTGTKVTVAFLAQTGGNL